MKPLKPKMFRTQDGLKQDETGLELFENNMDKMSGTQTSKAPPVVSQPFPKSS